MSKAFVAMIILAASSCGEAVPDPERMELTRPAEKSDRVTVQRIGIFQDDLAYGNRRGVYLIRDSSTGKEFIGVSGVGITEAAAHEESIITTDANGDVKVESETIEDER